MFCEPETKHYKKSKFILKTITFYLEDDNHQEIDFNQEVVTCTLQIIKI